MLRRIFWRSTDGRRHSAVHLFGHENLVALCGIPVPATSRPDRWLEISAGVGLPGETDRAEENYRCCLKCQHTAQKRGLL